MHLCPIVFARVNKEILKNAALFLDSFSPEGYVIS
jgi:hypothetical protein